MIAIPYADLATWALLFITLAAMAALIRGADWLVDGASGFAYRLGISKVIVGATVVSLGTTSPEAAVSVMAAWAGEPGLALGNAVGSIIVDTGFIFGLGCVLAVLPADRFILTRQGWVQVGSAVLLAGLCYLSFLVQGDAARLSRGVGVLLLGLLALYMVVSIQWSRGHGHDLVPAASTEDDAGAPGGHRPTPLKLIALMAAGIAIVLISSRILIGSVTVLAERWGIPEVVIAATLVAFGTSVPELATGMMSLVRGHRELLVGNVIGADILNVLFVVGASAAAAPLPIIDPEATIPAVFLYLHVPTMLIILLLFRVFIAMSVHSGSFARWMGVPLLGIYVGYTVLQFALFGGRVPVH